MHLSVVYIFADTRVTFSLIAQSLKDIPRKQYYRTIITGSYYSIWVVYLLWSFYFLFSNFLEDFQKILRRQIQIA